MTEAQVNAFLLAAEVGSIVHTAEVMYVSPTAISKHLSSLEKEWGLALFDRSRAGLRLTPGGRIMYNYLKGQSAELQRTIEAAKSENQSVRHELRVGCREEWNIVPFFSPAVAELRRDRPDINVSLDVLRDEELMKRLLTGQLDFALMTEDAVIRKKDVVACRLAKIAGGLLFSSEHQLANSEHLELRDFSEDTFFIVATGASPDLERRLFTKVRDRCRANGFEPSIAVVPSVASVYSKIRYNQGVLIVAEWSMERYNPAFRFVPFDIEIDICACWVNDSRSEVKRALYERLAEQLGGRGPC